jgi:hypothetical protein
MSESSAAVRLVAVNDQLGNRGEADRDLDAFFRGKAVCERHPNKLWPHDDCAGPGMPPPNEKAGDASARRR